MFGLFDYIGDIRRWWKEFNQQASMYEIGAFFLSHRMVVKRYKMKRRRR